jgi:hypothetical protein
MGGLRVLGEVTWVRAGAGSIFFFFLLEKWRYFPVHPSKFHCGTVRIPLFINPFHTPASIHSNLYREPRQALFLFGSSCGPTFGYPRSVFLRILDRSWRRLENVLENPSLVLTTFAQYLKSRAKSVSKPHLVTQQHNKSSTVLTQTDLLFISYCSINQTHHAIPKCHRLFVETPQRPSNERNGQLFSSSTRTAGNPVLFVFFCQTFLARLIIERE